MTTQNETAKTAEKAPKAVNYTAEQTEHVINVYKANPTRATVDTLAAELGRTSRSLIMKLTREGVYVKARYLSKAGTPPVKKEELIGRMIEVFSLSESEAESMAKANKSAMVKLLAAVGETVGETA